MPKKVKPGKRKPIKARMHTEIIGIAGMQHHLTVDGRKLLKRIVEREGELTCQLVPEPENEVDSKAVKVVGLDSEQKRFTGTLIGYVRRPVNEVIFELIKRKTRITSCVLIEVDPYSGEGDLELSFQVPS